MDLAHVTVTINEKKYNIACDDGQEAHLSRLGTYVDKRVGELIAAVGQIDDSKLLVMVALLVADELSDAYGDLESLRAGGESAAALADIDEKLAGTIDNLSSRIEKIADRVDPA